VPNIYKKKNEKKIEGFMEKWVSEKKWEKMKKMA
jgi:hypothetical protein